MKALIDTCVIVNVLQKREPFYKAAMDIVPAISNRQCLGVLTAKSVTDVYYILRRSLHNEEEVRKLLRIMFTVTYPYVFPAQSAYRRGAMLNLEAGYGRGMCGTWNTAVIGTPKEA